MDDGGQLRRFVNVYVNGDDVLHRWPRHDAQDGDEVSIVPRLRAEHNRATAGRASRTGGSRAARPNHMSGKPYGRLHAERGHPNPSMVRAASRSLRRASTCRRAHGVGLGAGWGSRLTRRARARPWVSVSRRYSVLPMPVDCVAVGGPPSRSGWGSGLLVLIIESGGTISMR